MDLYTTNEVVEELSKIGLNVQNQTIRKWEQRHADFPQATKAAGVLFWDLKAIIEWCEKTGRVESADQILSKSLKRNERSLRSLRDL